MTLSKREKVLAAVVAALGAGLVLWLGFGLFSGPLDSLHTQITAQEERLNSLQDQVLRAKKAQDRMAQWNRQALPSAVDRAGALYQSWLLELAGKAGFRQKKVEPGEVRNRGDSYHMLPFTVRGQASLEELITFLYEFYSANHLHQIRRLTVRPVEKSKDLDLVIAIEALSLPKADRTDQLSQGRGNRLARGSVEEYREAIGRRNVMSPYRPPPVVMPSTPVMAEPKPEPFDPSKFAYVTGIVEVNGEPQVWVKARTTDEKFQLRQGDKFQMGPFSATIARIDLRNVEIEIDGKRHTVPLGSSVRGGGSGAEKGEGKGEKGEGEKSREAEGEGGKGEGRRERGERTGPNLEGKGAGPMVRDSSVKKPGTEGTVIRGRRSRAERRGGSDPGEEQ
jgi:hypothetical protein